MKSLPLAGAVLAAAATLSACASTAAPHHPAASPSASAVATMSENCQQAILVTGAVRQDLETYPGDVQHSERQLRALAKSLPSGQLQVAVDYANLQLANFELASSEGWPTAKLARKFTRALDKIRAECKA